MASTDFKIRQLSVDDTTPMAALLDVFSTAFEDTETYGANRPSRRYLRNLLGRDSFIALIAEENDAVVAGLTAYELVKFEQERSEIYIYDLAVLPANRRQGIATSLINTLVNLARDRGVHVVIVQADYGDEAPISLYRKLGQQEKVLHFDIPVDRA